MLGRPGKKVKHQGCPGVWHALAALRQDVGVEHGRGTIVVPEPLLHGAEVGAAWAQVRGEGMAKEVGADSLRQPGTHVVLEPRGARPAWMRPSRAWLRTRL